MALPAVGCSVDGAGDAHTCSLTVSEASWGCTASVSMVSRRRWERAQTFHMLQVGDRGGSVTDPASGSGVTRWLDTGCRTNLVSPTTSLLLSGSTTHLSPSVLAPAVIWGSAELANALLPHTVGMYTPPQGGLWCLRYLPPPPILLAKRSRTWGSIIYWVSIKYTSSRAREGLF